ncbi:MAG: DUF3883 domain-containing protein [Planctomycetes bacterium]|nr:DUF3883 domain-containing protein [Planctomycetota bacterium]
MNQDRRARLETRAIIVGYAMSRLDGQYLRAFKLKSWKNAFMSAAHSLGVRSTSLKNLRDEFDPFHGNLRQGWHGRELRVSRQRVLGDLCGVSDDALIELVTRLLKGEHDATNEAIDAIHKSETVAYNVAERLLTGRRAEEFFLKNCESILDVDPADIVDCRNAAIGFDFGIRGNPSRAIEVKGMKSFKGQVLFTDREWLEAKRRKADYCLIVVGNLVATPIARIWNDPHAAISVTCCYQQSISVAWRSSLSVAV